MSIGKEFRDFAMRGNVVDMAIGIIIGGAFGKIVSSFVTDVIMPPIGILIGGVDFTEMMLVLKPATETAPAVALRYGSFINAIIDFVIIALAIFMVVKVMNSTKKKEEKKAEAPKTKDCPHCLSAVNIKATRCPFCTSELKAK